MYQIRMSVDIPKMFQEVPVNEKDFHCYFVSRVNGDLEDWYMNDLPFSIFHRLLMTVRKTIPLLQN